VPDGVRVYAIGDMHGCSHLLDDIDRQIAAEVAADPPEQGVFIGLGDYVDRGPDSAGVLERLAQPHPSGLERILLRGNHEVVMLSAQEDVAALDAWRQLGGVETLLSYGIDFRLATQRGNVQALLPLVRMRVPRRHVELLDSTRRSLTVGDYFFCHAGVRPGVALGEQRDEDLFWIREPFLSSGASFGRIVVHGHTPVDEPQIRANRINIDTGAYATNQLTCLVLEGAERRFLTARPGSGPATSFKA
jgi:serine/threonine protein phosphatase 1